MRGNAAVVRGVVLYELAWISADILPWMSTSINHGDWIEMCVGAWKFDMLGLASERDAGARLIMVYIRRPLSG